MRLQDLCDISAEFHWLRDKATLKAETHAFQCTTAGPYDAMAINIASRCLENTMSEVDTARNYFPFLVLTILP